LLDSARSSKGYQPTVKEAVIVEAIVDSQINLRIFT
jgi:hypothetical protein